MATCNLKPDETGIWHMTDESDQVPSISKFRLYCVYFSAIRME